jgi:hypothetical protein
MGQISVKAAMKQNTSLDWAMGSPSLFLAYNFYLGSFLIPFTMALATSLVLSGGFSLVLLLFLVKILSWFFNCLP